MTTERVKKELHGETRWCVVGDHGAVDFHFNDLRHLDAGLDVTAGMEFHRRAPAPYQRDKAADFPRCWILDGPCWCDGTSLYATEYLYPIFRDLGEDALWTQLEAEYERMVEQDVRDNEPVETATPTNAAGLSMEEPVLTLRASDSSDVSPIEQGRKRSA